MTGLVEILEVQRVVPRLVDRGSVKRRPSNLKFDDENNWANQENGIDPAPHARNCEFQEQPPAQTNETRLQEVNLRIPRITLRWKNCELPTDHQSSEDRVRRCLKEFCYGGVVPSSR